MNKLMIIGNLTHDPELRTTSTGVNVCSFSVAVNRRRSSQNNGVPEVDYFRVTAWRALGETCHQYLAKGRKVAVTGSVSVSTYEPRTGGMRASLEPNADDVEFLTPREQGEYNTPAPAASHDNGFQEVEDDLPF